MSTVEQRKFPAANEFTPGQLGEAAPVLLWLLGEVRANSRSQSDLVEVVRQRWFTDAAGHRSDPIERLNQQLKRSANVVTGMRQYGLISAEKNDMGLSSLGEEIWLFLDQGREVEAAESFARHLLDKAHGIDLLRAAETVRRRDSKAGGQAIADELRLRGFSIPNNNASAAKLRQWLEWSEVVDSEWNVNNVRLKQIVGFELDEVSAWHSLTWSQQAYLEALRDVSSASPLSWHSTRHILSILDERGVRFDRAQARRTIYSPLSAAGWVELRVESAGRGSKGGDVRLAPKSIDFDFAQVGLLPPDPLPASLQDAMGRDLPSVMADLGSIDTGVKGIALEVLAARLAQDLGLVPRQLRVRGVDTGGAEVDLIAERNGFSFERWTVQCKNQQTSVSVSVVAKEVGVAAVLRSNVVLIVTTSSFTPSAREFAKSVNQISATQVMLVDGVMIADYVKGGAQEIQARLHTLAQEVSRHKALHGVPL